MSTFPKILLNAYEQCPEQAAVYLQHAGDDDFAAGTGSGALFTDAGYGNPDI